MCGAFQRTRSQDETLLQPRVTRLSSLLDAGNTAEQDASKDTINSDCAHQQDTPPDVDRCYQLIQGGRQVPSAPLRPRRLLDLMRVWLWQRLRKAAGEEGGGRSGL